MSIRDRLRDRHRTFDPPELDARSAPDVRDAEWYRFLQSVRDLRASGAHAWADDVLARIAADVERTARVTAWQRATIARIVTSEQDVDVFGRRWR